jgi:RNA polymerase sigma-70 factor (ECF subfamily)
VTADRRISLAKTGDRSALGDLLEEHRGYLKLLARLGIGKDLQGKLDASDVVQDAFLDAQRYIEDFRGEDGAQFAEWLRRILSGTMSNTLRRYFGTQARDPRLERRIGSASGHSSAWRGLDRLAAAVDSPSQEAMRAERVSAVVAALARLPDDYQTVILHRHVDGLTFPQTAEKMGRSVDSVEKLWIRAVTRLRRSFGATA